MKRALLIMLAVVMMFGFTLGCEPPAEEPMEEPPPMDEQPYDEPEQEEQPF